MKKYTFIIAIAAMVMAMLPAGETFARKANTRKTENQNAGNIVVRHYGSDDRFIYLQVQLQQNNDKPAVFRIADEMGELLFVDRINVKNHTVTVKFRPEELERIELELTTAEGVFRKKLAVQVKTFSSTVIEEVSK